jgi:hypothetical protein
MCNRTPFVVSICSLAFLTTANLAAMAVVDSKDAAQEATIDAASNVVSDLSSKDEKKTEAQSRPEVIVRQLGDRLIFTAPQPLKKMCAKNERVPSPEMLDDPDIRQWYEIGDEQNPTPHNEVLWNLVATVKEHFINRVFPIYNNILVAFDIDETALTYFEYYYRYYQTLPINPLTPHINITRDCGANQPILDLYNFFKHHGCTVVFTSSRAANIYIDKLCITIQLEQLTWQGLRKAGYDVDEKDVHLCGDHALKKKVRQTLTRQAYAAGKGFDYVAAIDDDLYVLVEGDDLDCGIWVPSAYHVDNGDYERLAELPDPFAPTKAVEDEPAATLLVPSPSLALGLYPTEHVYIIITNTPVDGVTVSFPETVADTLTTYCNETATQGNKAPTLGTCLPDTKHTTTPEILTPLTKISYPQSNYPTPTNYLGPEKLDMHKF